MSEDVDEIWALYADDGAQSLDTVEAALINLRKDAENQDAVAELFRAMHTFKGNSRLLGLETIESCAHIAEDLIGLVRDEGAGVDNQLLDLLLEASDRLREMMEMAVETRADADRAISESINARMKEKYACMREGGSAATSQSIEAAEVSSVENPVEIVDENETFESAVVFGKPTESLAADPIYLKIFLEIARESISAISAAACSLALSGESRVRAIFDAADMLNNAATRIAIADWPALAAEFYATASDDVRLRAVLEKAEALYRRAGGEAEPDLPTAQAVATVTPGFDANVEAFEHATPDVEHMSESVVAELDVMEREDDGSFGAAAFLKEISRNLESLCDALMAVEDPQNAHVEQFCEPIQRPLPARATFGSQIRLRGCKPQSLIPFASRICFPSSMKICA